MIVPVVQIDDTTIGLGRPGKHTQKLMDALNNSIDSYYQSRDTDPGLLRSQLE